MMCVVLPDCLLRHEHYFARMTPAPDARSLSSSPAVEEPVLDARIRMRLGRQLQAIYAPVLDDRLDARLTALLQQLDQDPQGTERT